MEYKIAVLLVQDVKEIVILAMAVIPLNGNDSIACVIYPTDSF